VRIFVKSSPAKAFSFRIFDFGFSLLDEKDTASVFVCHAVEGQMGRPTLMFRWHEVKGKVLHRDVAFP